MKNMLLVFVMMLLHFSLCLAGTTRPLSIGDYFVLRDVSDVRISPDGKWVAYEVSGTDEKADHTYTNVYMVPFGGGDSVQLTFSGRDGHPRWSPDNRHLAFLSSRDNKEPQVYLLNRDGGEAYPVTDIEQGVEDFQWSPDGKKMLLVVTDPDPEDAREGEKKAPPPYVITRLFFKFDGLGYLKELYRHIYVMDITTREMKQITSGPYDDASQRQSDSDFPNPPQWSPDGKRILFVSNRTKEPDSNTNTDLFVVSAEGGEPQKLTINEGPDQMPVWSPDGKSIVYVTSVEPKYLWFDQMKIASIPAGGGSPRILTSGLDRNAWEPHFGKDGRIYFIVEDRGTQRIFNMQEGSETISEVSGEKVIYDYDLGPSGIVAFTASRMDLPGDVFAVSSGTSRQLTHVNHQLLDSIELGTVEKFQFTARDKTAVDGFITRPPGFDPRKKYPAILWIHGGPNEQETGEFYFRQQFFAARGYAVIAINYRGSTGYGKEFQRAIFADWGGKEIDDLMAGLDFVISKGYIDKDHIGVGGHSYGAILTNYLIVKTDRFKAAITDAGESNYLMDYGVDQYVLDWEAEVGKPWENPQRYIELSPYFHLANVKTPTLVVCGQEDWNVPLVNSEQLYLSLRRLGVETMLLVYPEQPHGFWRPSYNKDRYLRYIAWYDHFLKGATNKTPSPKS